MPPHLKKNGINSILCHITLPYTILYNLTVTVLAKIQLFINGGSSNLKKAHQLPNTGIRATVGFRCPIRYYGTQSHTYTKVSISTKYTIGIQC